MLSRTDHLGRLSVAMARSPITALSGPRQCGKTTLARRLATTRRSPLFDLESGTAERSGALPEPTDDPGDRLCDVNRRLPAQSVLPEIPFQVIENRDGVFRFSIGPATLRPGRFVQNVRTGDEASDHRGPILPEFG